MMLISTVNNTYTLVFFGPTTKRGGGRGGGELKAGPLRKKYFFEA